MKTIHVSEFTKYPIGRKQKDGNNSGEEFREKYLIPELSIKNPVTVDLDGTLGYGSSFLDEAFGGLLRTPHNFTIEQLDQLLTLTGPEDYVQEARSYMTDQALTNQKGK